ncbi:hypothetical protein T484DRAFT_2997414, partial [Baffinella frigidus]
AATLLSTLGSAAAAAAAFSPRAGRTRAHHSSRRCSSWSPSTRRGLAAAASFTAALSSPHRSLLPLLTSLGERASAHQAGAWTLARWSFFAALPEYALMSPLVRVMSPAVGDVNVNESFTSSVEVTETLSPEFSASKSASSNDSECWSCMQLEDCAGGKPPASLLLRPASARISGMLEPSITSLPFKFAGLGVYSTAGRDETCLRPGGRLEGRMVALSPCWGAV